MTPNDDFLVIGCDGVWECTNNEQMANYLYTKFRNGQNNLNQILDDLFQKNVAKDKDSEIGCDNMTCIIVLFKKKKK